MFPQSNRPAEKGVQVVKEVLKKTTETNENFWLGMLNNRSKDGQSPAELLQGSRLHTPLPDIGCQAVTQMKKHERTSNAAQCLTPLRNENVVRIEGTSWDRKAKITGLAGPCSYYVQTENCKILWRNQQHLLATKEQFDSDREKSSENNT